MSTQSEESEQPVCGVPAGPLPIFDGPNHDPLVPWHLLCPIEPLPLQENIMQAAMLLAEPCYPWLWQPLNPLELQEAIVQLAAVIHHHDI